MTKKQSISIKKPAKGRSIKANLTITKAIVKKAAAHDAGGSGRIAK